MENIDPGTLNMIFIGAMFLIVYFFMIRPQAARQREGRKFIEELEKGAEVVTASGIIGKITKLEEKVVTLEIGTKAYIRVTKSSISKEMTQELFGNA